MISTTVDRKTLAWIKEGVDETLQFVEAALTEFTENTEDSSPIQTCIGALHRVKGAVEMVEIEGARILAKELELLACALIDNRVKNKVDAAEVLAAGMYQLTGYLESLYHGHADLPLVLLPILNDCRACQERELFSEGDFFSPNLSASVPLKLAQGMAIQGDISSVAKRCRPGYLTGLLGVIKKENESENLQKLIVVLHNLLSASETRQAQQLWWVSLGVVESLKSGDLEPSIAIKILLGRVDRQIHFIINEGEHALTDIPLTNLIKNLLFYIAQSSSCVESVTDIKQAFELESAEKFDVDTARESLYGFNVNMVETLAEQLSEELLTIKGELDVVKHNKSGSTEGLDAVLKNFAIVTDTLSMLGLGQQKNLLSQQQVFLTQKIANNEILSDEDMMEIATALLYVESSINNLAGAMQQTDDVGGIPAAEYDNLLKLVAHELLEIIKTIKDAVDEYSSDAPGNIALLGDVPDLLKQLSSTMKTINDEQQSKLTNAINQYVCQELILNKDDLSSGKLDLLADAITGLENYYQAQIEESVAPELGLAVASQSLTQLGFPPELNTGEFEPYHHVA